MHSAGSSRYVVEKKELAVLGGDGQLKDKFYSRQAPN